MRMTYIYVMGQNCTYMEVYANDIANKEEIFSVGVILIEYQAKEKN